MTERHAKALGVERVLLVTVGAVAALLVAIWYAGSQSRSSREGSVRSQASATGQQYVRNTDTILVAIHNLARLETVSFHMERVIDLKEEHERAFGMLKAHDAILLVAAGDVVAGVDLSKLADGDLTVRPSERRVQLRLPPAEILSVTLDDDRTYVHSRQTTPLTKPVADLETRARKQAASAIRDAALQAGILERASRTAIQTLRALLLSLGYEATFVRHE